MVIFLLSLIIKIGESHLTQRSRTKGTTAGAPGGD